MDFTPEQLRAIHEDGHNILVSAGAGSGKTAVLTERVLRKLRQGVSLDSLIILTFTNAAATDMKQKIKEKILADETLYSQLSHLDNAMISTFDSFCLRFVQTHHSLLGLPSRIQITDRLTMEKVKTSVLDSVFQRFYETPTKAFQTISSRLFDKGDETLKEGVKALIRGLETIPKRHEYLEQYANRFLSIEQMQSNQQEFYQLIDGFRQDVVRHYQRLREEMSVVEDERIQRFVQEVDTALHALLTFTNLEQAVSASFVVDYPRLPAFRNNPELSTALKQVSEPLKEARNRFIALFEPLFLTNISDVSASIQETQECVMTIVEITKQYVHDLEISQRTNHLFDFSDIMELTIDLLEQHPEVRDHYRQSIDEVMVDEYQDTNDLQDRLLSLLEQDNLFMVGDVKQSIYGFRNANPLNFMKKYATYQAGYRGSLITLNQNFRSREPILKGINTLFESIMDEKIGGVNYRDNQALIYGFLDYDCVLGNSKYGPRVLSYSLKEEDDRDPRTIEGTIIAADIVAKCQSRYQVWDRKAKTLRDFRYADVAIIVDRKSGFTQYLDALVAAGIPVSVQSDESFVASTEIRFFENVLKLLNAMTQSPTFHNDFGPAFYGVARSFVYEIEDDAILDFLLTHRSASRSTIMQDLKHEPFTPLVADLETLIPLVSVVPIEELILSIIKRMKLTSHLHKLDDPANVEAKLDFLTTASASWPKCDFSGLLDYFRLVNESDELDIEYQKPPVQDQNAVLLLSMHKSKGLEFPVCYYPGLDKKFNFTENKGMFQFSSRYGLITKAWNNGFYDTILHTLHKHQAYLDYVSERLRLFYVAMTRAKEQINLLLNSTKPTEILLEYDFSGVVKASIRQRYKKYTDVLATVPATIAWHESTVPILSARPLEPLIDRRPIEDAPFIIRSLHFDPITIERHRYSKPSLGITDDATKVAIEVGTRYHRQLEFIDWHNPQTASPFLEPNLSHAIAMLLKTEPFAHRFESIIRQEYPFRDAQGNRGVIDLLVDDGHTIHVIDFKLKHLDDRAYATQLKGYSDYLRATFHREVKTYLYSLTEAHLLLIGGSLDA